MEDEGEEVVVTGTRLRDEDEASGGGGGDWGGGWAWVSFYSTPGGAGADGFDFGAGGGGTLVAAPEEQPSEEEPPPEEEGEEVVVTAPAPPTEEAFVTGVALTDWAWDNVAGDFRVTLDGDVAKLEFYDVLTGEHVEYVHSPEGQFWTEEPFDVESYERDPSFFQAPAYEEPIPVDWL